MRKFIELKNFYVHEQSAQVCFFGFQEGIAIISHVKIIPDSTFFSTGKYEIRIKNTDSTNINAGKIYFLGASDQMYEANAAAQIKPPYAKAAFQLLEIAIKNNKETVGYPISILSVEKNSFKWVFNGCCDN